MDYFSIKENSYRPIMDFIEAKKENPIKNIKIKNIMQKLNFSSVNSLFNNLKIKQENH
jgi:hypothetical protein